MKELTKIHPIRQAELDRAKFRMEHKHRFTVLAVFEDVKPCKRCEDPYCINNLPHYEEWNSLMRVVQKAAEIIKYQYPHKVFLLTTLNIYSDWGTVLQALIDFIVFHKSNLTPPQRMGDKEG